MNFKVKNNWHSCKTKNFKKFFEYKKKPKAEKNYNIKGKYHRSFMNAHPVIIFLLSIILRQIIYMIKIT